MTIPQHLQNLKGPRLSFELLPPVKDSSIDETSILIPNKNGFKSQ